MIDINGYIRIKSCTANKGNHKTEKNLYMNMKYEVV